MFFLGVQHGHPHVLSSLVCLLYHIAKVLELLLVFWGPDSRICPWPTNHRFLSVLVTPDTGSGYRLGSECLFGRDFYRLLSLTAISNLQSHTLNQKIYCSLGIKMLLTKGLQPTATIGKDSHECLRFGAESPLYPEQLRAEAPNVLPKKENT